MAGFGDTTVGYMRAGQIAGGMRIEAGEYSDDGATTASIPTQFNTLICGMALAGGDYTVTGRAEGIYDATGHTIDYTMTDSTYGRTMFIAFGW